MVLVWMLFQSSALSFPLPLLLPMVQVYATVPRRHPVRPVHIFDYPFPPPSAYYGPSPLWMRWGRTIPSPTPAHPAYERGTAVCLCTTSITTTRTRTLILLYPGPIESAHPHPRRPPTPPHARITNNTSSRASLSPPTSHCARGVGAGEHPPRPI
ncbi:hypothetical protein FIBSPDRAFT_859353 [Athelia psychrophila]|uniref:Secreted protein n=1 Tax=Athelia psychrophila TaxID=1759441 RepID=A0A166L5F4_9AGAM|nr:hypothetical protein FIBSPDRAFT_859353 [Fibularhizoctonia sp. CBS 109695]